MGFNQEEYKYDYVKANRKELISSSLPTINLATGDMNMSQSITTWALRGAFARLGYIYNDKYILNSTDAMTVLHVSLRMTVLYLILLFL